MELYIIGGGPAGLSAALQAAVTAGQLNRKQVHITLLEGGSTVGKKLSMTGNGKCNFTNRDMGPVCYASDSETGADWIRHFLGNDSLDRVLTFLQEELLVLPTEREGYYYPYSAQASSVVQAYENALAERKIRILSGHRVRRIEPGKDEICISGEADGKPFSYHADACILAAGGCAYPKTGSDGSGYMIARNLGLTVNAWHPALVPVCVSGSEEMRKKWTGVRARGSVTIYEGKLAISGTETGELQLTDYGISGIPVFQVSRQVSARTGGRGRDKQSQPQTGATQGLWADLDFLPDLTEEELTAELVRRLGRTGTVDGILNGKLVQAILPSFTKAEARQFTPNQIETLSGKLAHKIKHVKVSISQTKGYDMAQVCAGGVDLSQVDPETMELVGLENIYCIGELLDLDGRCGGYNIHAAILGGLKAGSSAVTKMAEHTH